MGSISKATVFDCGKNPPKVIERRVGLEVRREKLPNGPVVRWVDAQGNVVSIQMHPPAQMGGRKETSERKQVELRAKGWLELMKCPLSTGSLQPGDFPADKRIGCEAGSFGGKKGCCPHVQQVIDVRQAAQAKKYKERTMARDADRLATKALEQRKVDSQEQLNQKLGQVLDQVLSAKGKRAQD